MSRYSLNVKLDNQMSTCAQCRRSSATWRHSTRLVGMVRWFWSRKLCTDGWGWDAVSSEATVNWAVPLTSVASSTLAARDVELATSSFQIRHSTGCRNVPETLPPISRPRTRASKVVYMQFVIEYQHHSVPSPPGSPHPARITSSQSLPSLSLSITPSAFYSTLKTHLFLSFFLSFLFVWNQAA